MWIFEISQRQTNAASRTPANFTGAIANQVHSGQIVFPPRYQVGLRGHGPRVQRRLR